MNEEMMMDRIIALARENGRLLVELEQKDHLIRRFIETLKEVEVDYNRINSAANNEIVSRPGPVTRTKVAGILAIWSFEPPDDEE